MRRNLLLLVIFFTSLGTSYGQVYEPLATDASGDNLGSNLPDLETVSYRMDQSQDSIWFKITTYNSFSLTDDFGLMLGLDTNFNLTDGAVWNGSNTSMKYDVGVLVFQNFMSPGYYGYLTGLTGDAPLTVNVERPDNFTFIIRIRLSTLDNDGSFRMIAGGGAFDISSNKSTFDNVPEQSFLTVPAIPASGIGGPQAKSSMRVYPNPAEDVLYWNTERTDKSSQAELYDLRGRKINSCLQKDGKMGLSGLPAGSYILKMDGFGQIIQKL